MRVLLVEDHTIVRQALRLLLASEADIEIIGGAGNGRDGVDLADHLHPNIVLMDVMMPVMDGIQATHAIHAQHPEVCVIGLSMYEHADERMRAAGASAFVKKDALPDQLLGIMRACYQQMGEQRPPAAAA